MKIFSQRMTEAVTERLVRMETKLDQYNLTVETAHAAKAIADRNADDVRELKTRMSETCNTAVAAKNLSESNEADIAEMADTNKWIYRGAVGLGALGIINLAVNAVQGV